MSCVTSERVWISDDDKNFMLTNPKDDILHRLKDLNNSKNRGLHTVNSESKVIYIDEEHNIRKMSKNAKRTTTYIKSTHNAWTPECVYWSPSTGDVMVGMSTKNVYNAYEDLVWSIILGRPKVIPRRGKINCYNQTGQLIQTNPGYNVSKLYNCPIFLTENNNGGV